MKIYEANGVKDFDFVSFQIEIVRGAAITAGMLFHTYLMVFHD
jgi:hypothetical protein